MSQCISTTFSWLNKDVNPLRATQLKKIHPLVTHEKISPATFSAVTLFLMSSKARSHSDWIPS